MYIYMYVCMYLSVKEMPFLVLMKNIGHIFQSILQAQNSDER